MRLSAGPKSQDTISSVDSPISCGVKTLAVTGAPELARRKTRVATRSLTLANIALSLSGIFAYPSLLLIQTDTQQSAKQREYQDRQHRTRADSHCADSPQICTRLYKGF